MSPILLLAACGRGLVPQEPHTLHGICSYRCWSRRNSSRVIKPRLKGNPPLPLPRSDFSRMLLFPLLSPGSLRGSPFPFHAAAAASEGPLAPPVPLWSLVGDGARGCSATQNVPSPLASCSPLGNGSFFWLLLCLGLRKLSCYIVAELIKLRSPSPIPSLCTVCNTQFVC